MPTPSSNPTPPAPPVIVLGAARSGTKLLRSIIAASRSYAAVPHDVNYAWRIVEPGRSDDELQPGSLTASSRKKIRRMLARMAGCGDGSSVSLVEKTVSNALRVPFVESVFPDALYVHLVRDGREVTRSAMRCWQAPPEYGRLAGKLRSFPWWSCSGYAARCAGDWFMRFASGQDRLRSWGPRYAGIDQDVLHRSLAEVCGRQWRACVEHTSASLQAIDSARWIEVRYEELLNDPGQTAARIGGFLGIDDTHAIVEFARERVVKPQSKTAPRASDEELISLHRSIDPLRLQLGYGADRAA